jgi:hypothetical protein
VNNERSRKNNPDRLLGFDSGSAHFIPRSRSSYSSLRAAALAFAAAHLRFVS